MTCALPLWQTGHDGHTIASENNNLTGLKEKDYHDSRSFLDGADLKKSFEKNQASFSRVVHGGSGTSSGPVWSPWAALGNFLVPDRPRGGTGFLMTFGKSDHGKLGHGWGGAVEQAGTTAIAAAPAFDTVIAEEGGASNSTGLPLASSDGNLLSSTRTSSGENGAESTLSNGGHEATGAIASPTIGGGATSRLGSASCDNRDTPTAVASLAGIVLRRIDSLSTHSVAIAAHSGSLFTWGNGDKYRLGHGGTDKEAVPRLVASLRARPPVKDVACGLGHTLVLLVNGEVFAWGNGANGRLGLGDAHDRTNATPIVALLPPSAHCGQKPAVEAPSVCCYPKDIKESPSGQQRANERQIPSTFSPYHESSNPRLTAPIVAVFSGASHSLAVDASGNAYSWGKNNQGQCGTGSTEDQLLPAVPFSFIPLPPAEKSVCYASSLFPSQTTFHDSMSPSAAPCPRGSSTGTC